jgi:recombination protein RecA
MADFNKLINDMIKKDFGEGISVSAEKFLTKNYRTIPITPSLDTITGGIPEGSWVTVAGKGKCGKTSLTLHFAAKCQRSEYGSKHIYYLNVEGRLKKMNLNGIKGLDQKKMTIIESTQDKILNGQDFLTIGEKIIQNHPECVLIIDSYSSLCPEKEANEGIGTETRGGNAKLLAQFTRQMATVVPVQKTIVIGMTHLMANTSGYGASLLEKGGNAIIYQMDVKLKATKVEKWEEESKLVGQKVTWLCECAATGMPPGLECESYLRYGEGYDETKELIQFGCDLGLIEKAEKSSWYSCDYMKKHLHLLGAIVWNDEVKKKCKIQGAEALYKLMKEHPAWIEALDKEIKLMTGVT